VRSGRSAMVWVLPAFRFQVQLTSCAGISRQKILKRSPRKLEIVKNFGLKFSRPDFFRTEIKIAGKILGRKKSRRVTPYRPPCAIPAPEGAGARTIVLYYLYRELPRMQVIHHHRNWGMPTRRGRQPPRAFPDHESPSVSPLHSAIFSDGDPENAPQKPPVGRSHAQMTSGTSPKTLPAEARYIRRSNPD